ncbi:MAG: hypothetical protein KBT34_10430 [Prevotella sp.]|nr:hypothetical protein [Candidatus Prevotella equi]
MAVNRRKSYADIVKQFTRIVGDGSLSDARYQRVLNAAQRYTQNIRDTKTFQNAKNDALSRSASSVVFDKAMRNVKQKKFSRSTYMGTNGG